MANKKEIIGYVSVDAGILYVGDPCYQSSDSDFADWNKFCDKMFAAQEYKQDGIFKLNDEHEGRGIVVSTVYGDGIYPVYATRNKEGRIKRISIDLD